MRPVEVNRVHEDSLVQELRPPVPEDQVDVSGLIRALWRRKWMIFASTLACALVFLLLTSSRTSLYTTNSTLMLDARQQQILTSREQVVSDLQLNNAILDSEVAVLRSGALLRRVVDQIGIDRFDGIDPALREPSMLAKLIWKVQSALSSPETTVSEEAPLVSPEQRRMNRIVAALRSGIYIGRQGDSYVMDVSVTTPDPELSALVANGIANTYIDMQVGERKRVAESATEWLTQQVQDRGKEVADAEAAVEQYKQEQLENVGASLEVIEQQLAELNQQLASTRSAKATEQARLQQLEAMVVSQGAMAAAETQSSEYLMSLRASRDDLLREDARLATTFGPSHPDRRKIASDLSGIDQSISREVENIAQGYRNGIEVLEGSEASLQQDVAELEQRLSGLAASSLQLRQLEREADAKRETYQELLARLGETRAQAEIQRAEAKLVNEALIPLGPSAPRPMLMTAFGATLGLTVSLIVALLLELVSAGFRSGAELARATNLPVLATLPRTKLRRPRNVLRLFEKDPHSQLAERVRQLRTLLRTGTPMDGEGRSLLLMSSVPNEGKTTCAIALADFYARSGVSTILLDLDTRRGLLSRELEVEGGELGEHLGGAKGLEEVIAKPDSLRFHVLGLGQRGDMWADSLSERQIAAIIQRLKQSYDMVIVDAPPVLAVSDGLSIAMVADDLLYLVRWKKTKRSAVTQGLATLKSLGIEPSGLVLSMADVDSIGESYAYK
ncbi:hypothetical protein AYJ57_22620 (plasmid) [Salipiger sp. CCB-MM3]|nr:hypothetical protein AYJ57_22620 [Salipiger sp. CCB-MM3]